jgi:hypothetical protein
MSAADRGRASAVPGEADASWLRSRNELVGAWAQGVLQLWDLAVSWWKLVPEQGEAEEMGSGSWSTSVFYPRRRDRDVTVGWSGLSDDRGEVVPAGRVQVQPTAVAAGPGNTRLRVTVGLPAGRAAYHLGLTIYDRDSPDDPSFRRQYGLGFGVPGAAV